MDISNLPDDNLKERVQEDRMFRIGQPVYFELNIWVCPICNAVTRTEGDERNPVPNVVGDKMCPLCIRKIQNLLGVTKEAMP